jgi:TnpA family transposase
LKARSPTTDRVVENWNSANDFIPIGKGSELAAYRRGDQEVTVLALHLLQNAMVYINTLMIQRVLSETDKSSRYPAKKSVSC